ncbi:hypothetical protein [Ruegeria sp. EL01]|uniref:hypothetical protein n=1 Tax=Ruegeria sp. EL01 TaxID=2107578 RepID=UPI0013C4133F|nr:hypothetical protein [Ruegeria sp. EL01]
MSNARACAVMCRAQQNSMWQHAVRKMLGQGYGVEDIAVIKGFNVDHVRREIRILREAGELSAIYERYRR